MAFGTMLGVQFTIIYQQFLTYKGSMNDRMKLNFRFRATSSHVTVQVNSSSIFGSKKNKNYHACGISLAYSF
jgi:hypothetical protein